MNPLLFDFLRRLIILAIALGLFYAFGPMFEGLDNWQLAKYRTRLGSLFIIAFGFAVVAFLIDELLVYRAQCRKRGDETPKSQA